MMQYIRDTLEEWSYALPSKQFVKHFVIDKMSFAFKFFAKKSGIRDFKNIHTE